MNSTNNNLACRKYYEKKKNNPEFVMKKRLLARRQYYRKRYTWFYKIFQMWKNLFVKNTRLSSLKHVNKRLKSFSMKRNKLLLKIMIDRWKDYERTPVKINNNYNPIVCSFF